MKNVPFMVYVVLIVLAIGILSAILSKNNEPDPNAAGNSPSPDAAQSISFRKELCERKQGKWLEEVSECEASSEIMGLSKEDCYDLGGVYDSCSSPCRHMPRANMCEMACVVVCSFAK